LLAVGFQPVRWLISRMISSTSASLLWEKNTVSWLISPNWNLHTNMLFRWISACTTIYVPSNIGDIAINSPFILLPGWLEIVPWIMKCIKHFSLKKYCCTSLWCLAILFTSGINQLSGTIFRVWPRSSCSPGGRNSMETAETIWKLKKKVRKIEINVCPNYFSLCFLYPNKRSIYTQIINARRTLHLKICLPTEETVRN